MSEVKGQEPLPQATERLLQATTRRKPPAVSPVADYFALSVTAQVPSSRTVTESAK